MRRSLPLFLAAAISAAALPARADVGPDSRLLQDTGFTLKQHELKVGLLDTSYGVTNRLQLSSYLLADLFTFLNLGVKYRVVDAPNLAVAVEGWGGMLVPAVVLGIGFFDLGGQADASVPLRADLLLHLAAGVHYWRLAQVSAAKGVLTDGRVAWPKVNAELEWDLTHNHVLLFTLGTPTSWLAASQTGSHDFDATDFWEALVGYQLSYKLFNVRLDLGYGPSLFGRGVTGAFDFYFRI